jgi:hypothetical protein
MAGSAGDLIICARNDHSVHARQPGRTLAHGDLRPIDAVTPDGLLVRRALDADPRTGQRPAVPLPGYQDAEPGCAGHRPRRARPHHDRWPGRDHRHR